MATDLSSHASFSESQWDSFSMASQPSMSEWEKFSMLDEAHAFSPQSQRSAASLSSELSTRRRDEAAATRFLEEALGAPLPSTLRDSLRSGVRLNQLLKRLFPGKCVDLRWFTQPTPANAAKNITIFLARLKVCAPASPTFELADLESDAGNFARVVATLLSLVPASMRPSRVARGQRISATEEWEMVSDREV